MDMVYRGYLGFYEVLGGEFRVFSNMAIFKKPFLKYTKKQEYSVLLRL